MTQTRAPKGIPAGGQFAGQSRDESDVALEVVDREQSAADQLDALRTMISNEIEGLGGWEDEEDGGGPAGSGADHADILYRVLDHLGIRDPELVRPEPAGRV